MARALAIIGLLLLCGAASTASADWVYGCRNNSNGRISKFGTQIPSCGRKQTPVSWDTDPTPTPAASPTKIITDGQPLGSIQLLCEQETCVTLLVTLDLDPGSYLLLANLGSEGNGASVFCYVVLGTELIPNATTIYAGSTATPQLGGVVPMSIQAPVTLGAASKVSLICTSNGTASYAINWRLTALTTGQIN